MSMTDFVLLLQGVSVEEVTNLLGPKYHKLLPITYERYAKFVNQPLELGMFIPCDKDQNPLKEPNDAYYPARPELYARDMEKYEQAKNRCIFKNVEYEPSSGIIRLESNMIGVYPNIAGNFSHHRFDKVEDLASISPVLNPAVIKSIGL